MHLNVSPEKVKVHLHCGFAKNPRCPSFDIWSINEEHIEELYPVLFCVAMESKQQQIIRLELGFGSTMEK